MSELIRALVTVFVLALLAPPHAAGAAEPANDEAVARARAYFEEGRAHYEQRRFREAIRAFEAGQALAPRPLFLLNIGQAHRQLFELEAARESYQQYMAATPADDPGRAEVSQLIVEIDGALAARIVAPPPGQLKKKPFIRRHWWIIPVSAVAAAGLSVGLYFALRPTADEGCDEALFGCLKTSR